MHVKVVTSAGWLICVATLTLSVFSSHPVRALTLAEIGSTFGGTCYTFDDNYLCPSVSTFECWREGHCEALFCLADSMQQTEKSSYSNNISSSHPTYFGFDGQATTRYCVTETHCATYCDAGFGQMSCTEDVGSLTESDGQLDVEFGDPPANCPAVG